MKETVKFHGKDYETVASRVHRFREDFSMEYGIVTSIVHINDDSVTVQAIVTDSNDRTIGTGHAEERRSKTGVNSNNALENAETSAIGRALASCGYAGTEYASADEMSGVKTEDIAAYEALLRGCQNIKELSDTWTEVYGNVDKPGREILGSVKDEMKAKLS